MSLKDDWKESGKDIGRTIVDLGKSIVKSAKVGTERAFDEQPKNPDGTPVETDLRGTWSKVGHDFGSAGKSLGKAIAGTAKTVTDSVDKDKPADYVEDYKKDTETK